MEASVLVRFRAMSRQTGEEIWKFKASKLKNSDLQPSCSVLSAPVNHHEDECQKTNKRPTNVASALPFHLWEKLCQCKKNFLKQLSTVGTLPRSLCRLVTVSWTIPKWHDHLGLKTLTPQEGCNRWSMQRKWISTLLYHRQWQSQWRQGWRQHWH